jgi:hypothetical protein
MNPPNIWMILGMSAAAWGAVLLVGWGIWWLWGLR